MSHGGAGLAPWRNIPSGAQESLESFFTPVLRDPLDRV